MYYYLQVTLAQIPYLLLLTLIQWGLVWALAGLNRTFTNFLVGYATSIGVAFISTTLVRSTSSFAKLLSDFILFY